MKKALSIAGSDSCGGAGIQADLKTMASFGPYFVIKNNIAIPHGQIDENVNGSGVGVLYVKEGVLFPEDRLVKLIILVASNNKNILINTVKRITEISEDIKLYEKLNQFSHEDILEYLKGGN